MNVNYEYYKVFYYVAKNKSITLAAKELSITQPAVSQVMKQLEEVLGVKLIVRASKGINLTDEGVLLMSYVEKAYEQISLGEKKLIQMQNLELGEVRIGASDMTLQYFLLPYLEIFHEKYPEIKVIVTNAPTPETLNNLQNGVIDFGVVSSPFIPSGDNIETIPVREIEDVFVAGRRFLPYKNRMLDFKELEKMPLVMLEGKTSSRTYIENYIGKSGVELNPEFELATSDMIVQFAVRSLGVGCVVKDFAKPFLEEGKLFELRFNQMIPKRQFCLVKNTKNPLNAAAGKLLDIIFH